MTENYDQESEHSIMAKVTATEADAILPLKMEMPVLSLDASSQASAAEMEASMESNPVGAPCLQQQPIAADSSSPIVDFSKLQSDVHMAVSSMFTARRSSDLEIQHAIQDFEVSLQQREAEAATTNEKAKVAPVQGGT